VAVPAPTTTAAAAAGPLPAAFWAYWGCLAMSVAIEFCVLLWAPTYLEKVVELSGTAAAGAAAAFSAAMLLGRTPGAPFISGVPAERLFGAGLVVGLIGFALYWGMPRPLPAIAGLFVIGLGVALLYPLSLALAVNAAGRLSDAASARTMMAVGLAILTMPA